MRKPLEGLFVVEMTSYWSATTTARFLRDMGARVVRVETPPIGDFCRYYGRSMGMPITAEENPIHDIFKRRQRVRRAGSERSQEPQAHAKHARQGGRIHH